MQIVNNCENTEPKIEPEQKEQLVYHGIVSRWMRAHGFIKIPRFNNEPEITYFGHASQVNWKDLRKKITLRPGMEVSFKVSQGPIGKPEAVQISARGKGNNLGEPLDFHQKYGASDPYDRVIQYGGKIFRGNIKFFDSRQLYGKVVLTDEIDQDNPEIGKLRRDDIFFKAVDALGEEYPFQIRRGRTATFKLYFSKKYGWGAYDVMDGDGKLWPSYKSAKIARKREQNLKNLQRREQALGRKRKIASSKGLGLKNAPQRDSRFYGKSFASQSAI